MEDSNRSFDLFRAKELQASNAVVGSQIVALRS
jgi:hypothetical protein